jgi:hypothetical protein
MKQERLDEKRAPQPEQEREPYEAPRMEPLGTMLELTEANEFHKLDLSGLSPTSF